MKAKTLFITAFLFMQWQLIFSQCLSIELSITWEIGYDILKKDSVISIPKLNIIYRNNCNMHYYFVKLRQDDIPSVLCLLTSQATDREIMHPDYFKYHELYGKYANQNFSINVGEAVPRLNSGIWMIEDCDLVDEEYDTPQSALCAWADCYLRDIYRYIRLYNNLPEYEFNLFSHEGDRKFELEPEDLLPENILGYLKDQFLFLKAGETHTDSYNLIAFKIVEGCFTFFIKQENIKNYVVRSEYSSEMRRFVRIELELPEIVGEYSRYVGGFNTNKVTVCFGERSDVDSNVIQHQERKRMKNKKQ